MYIKKIHFLNTFLHVSICFHVMGLTEDDDSNLQIHSHATPQGETDTFDTTNSYLNLNRTYVTNRTETGNG